MAGVETLTDEQIDDLLSQAEARLRAKSQGPSEDPILFEPVDATSKARKPYVQPAMVHDLIGTDSTDRLPQLRHGLARAGYLRDNQGVVETNPKAFIAQPQDISQEVWKPSGLPQNAKKIVCDLSSPETMFA